MQIESILATLKGVGTPQCEPWRNNILLRHHGIAGLLARQYLQIEKADGYIAANQWLGKTTGNLKLGGTGLSLGGTLDELEDYCKAKAKKTERQIYETAHAVGKEAVPAIIKAVVEKAGVSFPLDLDNEYSNDQLIAAFARVCDECWWKSQLRSIQWRLLEDFIRRHGDIHKRREIYVSDLSLGRRLEQKRKNKKLLERLEAENQDGQTYTLSELAELSPANPIIRRAELMTRLSGFEAFANNSEENYQGVCYTLTCPSRFHAVHIHGKQNAKYDGSSVSEAQDYLNKVWQRTRASLDRAGIDVFGMRVAEPQHDGTPHWHILLFIKADQEAKATEIFRRYALEMDGDEPGALEHRLDVLMIDPDKGTATGYLAKYIAKNIDGYNVGQDSYGKDAIQSAVRVEAWASIHGIRQFQQIGGASITVWRELRRLGAEGVDKGLTRDLVKAADESDWEGYNRLMGGVVCPRKDRPVRPMMLERPEENRYGETIKAIQGLWFGTKATVTRLHTWVVRMRKETTESESKVSEDGVGFGAALSTAPPGACAPLEFCQ